MHWLQTLDIALFRFCNSTLQNRVFDVLMPIASGNALFFPILFIVVALLAIKGNARVRVMLFMLLVILPLGDSFICDTIKHATLRLRPFAALDGVHQLVIAGRNNSMPSSHAANWAAATMIVFIYLGRRSLWFMLPLGLTVSFSRIYNGVHYPSDILAGWILGAGYAATGVWVLDRLWHWLWKKFFPSLPIKPPSLLIPEEFSERFSSLGTDFQFKWLNLGYVFIALTFVGGLAYIASGTIGLSEDETYYWLWSKHLALSYYSKPPLTAYTIWLGTHLFGDTDFGVRFFSPVAAALMGLFVLRFMAREVNARAGFILLLAVSATPLLAVGSIVMTIDPLSVLFWTVAMLAGWRAVRENSTVRDWLWVGLWMGLGFLSKYTALFQLLCWAVFFALWKPARIHLRRPGPYLALLVEAICTLPVLIWNAQHGWVTTAAVAGDAHTGETWHFRTHEFLANEFALLNPVFFVGMICAVIAFCRGPKKTQLQIYLFSMGAPLFLVYMLWSCHSRVLPNWIAPSVLPLFCLATVYWEGRNLRCWLPTGLAIGFAAVVLLHEPAIVQQILRPFNCSLPGELARVCGWRESGEAVKIVRDELLAEGGQVFVIGGHYGVASQMAFQLGQDGKDIYCLTGNRPESQFYFWPGYADRHGQNAVFVQSNGSDALKPPPVQLMNEFSSVTSVGVYPVDYHGQTIRWLQIFECRDLR